MAAGSGNAEVSEKQPAVAPSRALTIKPSRLAGSDKCLNCGTPLQGPFCHFCGQPDKRLIRFFPVLIREFFEDFLELDTRFTRTMKPLLFKPGRLTRDYLDGRRYRYTPPMRLFIFSSMLFFILAATLAGNAIQVGNVRLYEEDKDVVALSGTASLAEEIRKEVRQDLERERAQAEEAWEGARDRPAPDEPPAPAPDDDDFSIRFGNEDWDRETNPLIIPGMPDSVNEWINDEIEKSPQKAREIEENPNIIVEKIFELLPATMFIMLPIVALLFKFWYLFAKKFYIEHLIHALHNHAFLFVVLTITLLNNALISWRVSEGGSDAWHHLAWLNAAIYVWIPIYLLVSLKTVYGQGWFLTVCKYCVIGLSYVVLLTLVTTVVALLGFLLL